MLAEVSATEVGDRIPIGWGRDAHPRESIVPSYEGQDHEALLRLIPDFSPDLRPRLDVIRLSGGYVHFGPRADGIVMTADGCLVRETARFSGGLGACEPDTLRHAAQDVDEDWVTVLDCAWHNHFHLLALAMPKLRLARRHLPEAGIVVPMPRAAAPGAPASSLERMMALDGGAGVRRVRDGLYRVRTLHLIWSNYDRGTFLHFFDEPFVHLQALAGSVPSRPARPLPQRIFIARPHDPRIDGLDGLPDLYSHLEAAGFVAVQLETLAPEEQVQLFRDATHVVGAHGAGLSNIVFGNPGLRVLEINLDLDGLGYLRPWFLLLASGRGLHYQYLNASAGQFAASRIAEACARFLATH